MGTLNIGTWSSKCEECGKGADPSEKTHDTILGYGAKNEVGCGVEWTHVTTGYAGNEKLVGLMRPDLTCVGMFDIP